VTSVLLVTTHHFLREERGREGESTDSRMRNLQTERIQRPCVIKNQIPKREQNHFPLFPLLLPEGCAHSSLTSVFFAKKREKGRMSFPSVFFGRRTRKKKGGEKRKGEGRPACFHASPLLLLQRLGFFFWGAPSLC